VQGDLLVLNFLPVQVVPAVLALPALLPVRVSLLLLMVLRDRVRLAVLAVLRE